MTRTATTDQEPLIDLIRERTASMVAAVRTGQPQATKLVIELLGDYLTDKQAVVTLIQELLAGTNTLQGVITDLIWTECEELAKAELTAQARARREPTTADRAHRYLDHVAA